MSPPPRASAGLAFDWRRLRVVLFGGQGMPAGRVRLRYAVLDDGPWGTGGTRSVETEVDGGWLVAGAWGDRHMLDLSRLAALDATQHATLVVR